MHYSAHNCCLLHSFKQQHLTILTFQILINEDDEIEAVDSKTLNRHELVEILYK